MGGRRKNPHPKRAVNVKTVLKGDEKEERGRGEEKEGDEELRLLRMLQKQRHEQQQATTTMRGYKQQ